MLIEKTCLETLKNVQCQSRLPFFLSNVSEVKVNISAPPTPDPRHDSWHEAQLRSHVKALEVH